MSRKTPKDVAETLTLDRIKSLAIQVLGSMRNGDRNGVYDSERTLMTWIQEDGYAFSKSDIPPALALLEAAGFIERLPYREKVSRPGRLAGADIPWPDIRREVPEEDESDGVPDDPTGVIGAARVLANYVQMNGSQGSVDLPRIFRGMPRTVPLDEVVAYAVGEGWLEQRGDRVLRGDVEPEPAPTRGFVGAAASSTTGFY